MGGGAVVRFGAGAGAGAAQFDRSGGVRQGLDLGF